jgi:hypothetical protein
MNRIRIDELNGKTLFFGVRFNTHERTHTREHNESPTVDGDEHVEEVLIYLSLG